jgi:hypothetical protein
MLEENERHDNKDLNAPTNGTNTTKSVDSECNSHTLVDKSLEEGSTRSTHAEPKSEVVKQLQQLNHSQSNEIRTLKKD